MRSLSCLVPLLLAAGPLAAQAHQHTPGMVHGAAAVEPPREAGQAAFAAIAEIVARLEADPMTDWSRVDLEALRQFGLDIVQTKTRTTGYYIGAREFELPELKLLVDAVQSSRFLSERKSMQLIAKLETLASQYAAGSLRRQVTVAGRVKTMNESVYYSVDLLHEAIQKNSRITFRYFDYDLNGSRRYRPGLYTASPYALCWQDENYYLIAHSERHGLTHYRVDKMASISLTGEPRYMDAQTRGA